MSDSYKRRVLVVDDETQVRVLVGRILEKDCEVDTAANADDALKLTNENEYHAVISDYEMPGNDGITLLKKIEESSPQSLRVLHTGNAPKDVGSHIENGVVHNFIPKPARIDDFNIISEHEPSQSDEKPNCDAGSDSSCDVNCEPI